MTVWGWGGGADRVNRIRGLAGLLPTALAEYCVQDARTGTPASSFVREVANPSQ